MHVVNIINAAVMDDTHGTHFDYERFDFDDYDDDTDHENDDNTGNDTDEGTNDDTDDGGRVNLYNIKVPGCCSWVPGPCGPRSSVFGPWSCVVGWPPWGPRGPQVLYTQLIFYIFKKSLKYKAFPLYFPRVK